MIYLFLSIFLKDIDKHLAFFNQQIHRHHHYIFRHHGTNAFNIENEMITDLAQLNRLFQVFMAEHISWTTVVPNDNILMMFQTNPLIVFVQNSGKIREIKWTRFFLCNLVCLGN